jgi:hypothetical protein
MTATSGQFELVLVLEKFMNRRPSKQEVNESLKWADSVEDVNLEILAAEVRALRQELVRLQTHMAFAKIVN